MDYKKAPIAINHKAYINQFIDGYETDPAKGLIHGFQKDVIQNGWGHKKNKIGKDWKQIIKYCKNRHGEFVVVEDCGSTGLIGKIYTNDELEKNIDKLNDPDEKLARFCTLYSSGGNTESAGLFGRGKLMYQAVSEEYTYYFDSLREDGIYVANHIEKNRLLDFTLEGQKAKDYIFNQTGFEQKYITGTRIIIKSPKKELVDAIKSGLILEYINETWWKIVKKYNAQIEVYNGEKLVGKAEIPDFYKKYIDNPKYSYFVENLDLKKNNYRVKNLGIFYCEPDEIIPEGLENISYYRKDMKIGDVFSIRELPIVEKYKDRIFGYIEFDNDWEEDLEENEQLEHYGIKNKRAHSFQSIKKVLEEHLDEFSLKKRFKKENQKDNINSRLKNMSDKLTDFLVDCNVDVSFDAYSSIKRKKPVIIEAEKKYPNIDNRTVEHGQDMSFKYKITKNTIDNKFEVKILITSPTGEMKIYNTKTIDFNSNEYVSNQIDINCSDFFNGERNVVKITVESLTNSDCKNSCTFPVFVETDDIEEVSDIEFAFKSIKFPDDKSRTVRHGETVKNIVLSCKNNLNTKFTASIRGFTQDVNNRNNEIETIYTNLNIELIPGEQLDINVNDITFNDLYYNRKGPLRIKFKMAHMEGLEMDKAEIIAEISTEILYEVEQKDETISPYDIYTVSDKENKHRKVELKRKGNKYDLIFNTEYYLYKDIPENEKELLNKIYYLSEMMRAIIHINLDNEKYSIINCDEDTIKEMSVKDIAERVSLAVDKHIGEFLEVRN